MSADKKSRGSRFTQAMSDALIQEYRKHQFVLQGKFSDTLTNEKKKEAWGRVTEAVNAVNTGERKNADQVKKRWEDMAGVVKKKERETRNKELRRLKVTGNGHLEDQGDAADLSQPCTSGLNSFEKEVAVLLGPQSFTGILGGQDSMDSLGHPSKGYDNENNLEADEEEDSLQESKTSCTASAICSDPAVTLKEVSLQGTNAITTPAVTVKNPNSAGRKRPAKTLAQAQLEYFETVTAYYKLKMEKLEVEINLLKEQKKEVQTSFGNSQDFYFRL